MYTLGNIGAHRIVCTKLPSVGHTREAMTSAGNTTTRLLGKSSIGSSDQFIVSLVPTALTDPVVNL